MVSAPEGVVDGLEAGRSFGGLCDAGRAPRAGEWVEVVAQRATFARRPVARSSVACGSRWASSSARESSPRGLYIRTEAHYNELIN